MSDNVGALLNCKFFGDVACNLSFLSREKASLEYIETLHYDVLIQIQVLENYFHLWDLFCELLESLVYLLAPFGVLGEPFNA